MPLTDQLMAFWPMNEVSDGSGAVNRVDLVSGYVLNDLNTTPSTTGMVYAQSANLTRANAEGFYLDDIPQLSLDAIDLGFTLGVWVTLTSKPAAVMHLVSKGTFPGDLGYFISYENTTDRLRGTVGSTTTSRETFAATFGAPSTGVPYFVLLWRDDTDDRPYISVNDSTPETGDGTVLNLRDDTGEFNVGFQNGIGQYADAVIGPIMFWKRTLTAGERTQVYNGGAGLTYAAMLGAEASLNVSLQEPIIGSASL